jgi:hypothetical protein
MALHLKTKIDAEAATEGFKRMNEAVKDRAEAQTARVVA